MKKWLHFKTLFRAALFAYWSLVFFVSPWFLLALFPYGAMRYMLLMEDNGSYVNWKNLNYGKSDEAFTVRKLYYLLVTSEKLDVKKASVRQYAGDFDWGYLYIDEHLRIVLERKRPRYEVSLFFKEQKIAISSGFLFQKIKWDLTDFPEIEKILAKFPQQMAREFEHARNEISKADEKKTKKQKEHEEAIRKALAKEARQVYKKDMSI